MVNCGLGVWYFTSIVVNSLSVLGAINFRRNGRYQARPIFAHIGDRVEFPYLCSILFNTEFVGACTIIQKNWVITSISNMDRQPNLFKEYPDRIFNKYWQNVTGLRVHAGSSLIDPTFLKPDQYYQEKSVKTFAVIPKYAGIGVLYPTRNFSDQVEYDVVGPGFNICFLEVEDFTWSYFVMPIYLKYSTRVPDKNFETRIGRKIRSLELNPFTNASCKITGWHRPTYRQIFHHVIYIPRAECQQMYCGYNRRYCLRFPVKEYHVCFKSAGFSEPCPTDTGSALLCLTQKTGFKILGILTTSLTCAESHLPSVYTTIPSVVLSFIRVTGPYIMDESVHPY